MTAAATTRRTDAGTITAGASAAIAVLGLAQAKVVAVLLGPAGVALLGQLGGIYGTCVTLVASGPGLYLVRQVAANQAQPVRETAQVSTVTLLSGAALGLATMLLSGLLADATLASAELWWAVVAVGVAVALASATTAVRSLLQGREFIGSVAVLDISQAVASLVAMVVAVQALGAPGALASWPVAALLVAATASLLWLRSGHRLGSLLEVPSVGVISEVGRFTAAVTVSIVAYQMSFVVVRSMLIRNLGESEAGLYHAALSISLQVLAVALFSQTTHIFPRLSALRHEPAQLVAQLDEVLKLMVGLFVPIAVVLVLAGPQLVALLLSQSFNGSVHMLRLQLLLDLVKIVPWTLQMALLPLGLASTLSIVSVAWAVVFAGGTLLLLPLLGADAPYGATFAAHAVMTAAYYLVLRRRYDYRLAADSWRVVALSFATLGAAILLAQGDLGFGWRAAATAVLLLVFSGAAGPTMPPVSMLLAVRQRIVSARRSS